MPSAKAIKPPFPPPEPWYIVKPASAVPSPITKSRCQSKKSVAVLLPIETNPAKVAFPELFILNFSEDAILTANSPCALKTKSLSLITGLNKCEPDPM